MLMGPEDLESWRIFFKSSGFDIFVIINKAIMVATKDYPLHFKLRREQITSLLYHNGCSFSQDEPIMPAETKSFPPNANGENHVCESGFNKEGHQNQKRTSVELDKSFIIEDNGANEIPTNQVEGNIKETEAVDGEEGNQRIEHQGQLRLAVNPIEDSNKLGSHAVLNSKNNNSSENLNKKSDGGVQHGLNKNATIEVSSDSINLVDNGMSIGTDGVVQALNKTGSSDQSVGSKNLSCKGTFGDKLCDSREGVNKGTAKSNHLDNSGPNLNLIRGSSLEHAREWKDLNHEGNETYQEVLNIKRVLEDHQNQTDMVLLELLRRLKNLDCNVEILKATLIGKAVTLCQKHEMKEIRQVVRSLVREWKMKVDEWVTAQEAEIPSSANKDGNILCPTVGSGEDIVHAAVPLSSEDAKGRFHFAEVQVCSEKEQPQIDINSERNEYVVENPLQLKGTSNHQENRNNSIERISEEKHKKSPFRLKESFSSHQYMTENLKQNPFQLKGVANYQENNRPPADENKLDRFGRIQNVTGRDYMMKQREHFPSSELPKANKEMNSEAKNTLSENVLMKQGVKSPVQLQNKQKLKECVGIHGRQRGPGEVVKRNVESSSTLNAGESLKDEYENKFDRFGRIQNVKGRDYMTKQREHFPSSELPKVNKEKNSESKNTLSENVLIKQGVISLVQPQNNQKLKECVGIEGTHGGPGEVVMRNVESTSTLKPGESLKDKNENKFDRFGRIQSITGRDYMMKQREHFPSSELPKVNKEKNSEAKNTQSENVLMKQGVISPVQPQNKHKLKECVGIQGTHKGTDEVAMLNIKSSSTLKPGESLKDKNRADFGRITDKYRCSRQQESKSTDKLNIPQGDALKKVDKTRKEPEGYRKTHDAKKRHCIQMLDGFPHHDKKHRRHEYDHKRHG